MFPLLVVSLPNLEHVRVCWLQHWSPGLASGDLGHSGLEGILRSTWSLWDVHSLPASSFRGCLKGTGNLTEKGECVKKVYNIYVIKSLLYVYEVACRYIEI